jgi:hypothetical protein
MCLRKRGLFFQGETSIRLGRVEGQEAAKVLRRNFVTLHDKMYGHGASQNFWEVKTKRVKEKSQRLRRVDWQWNYGGLGDGRFGNKRPFVTRL